MARSLCHVLDKVYDLRRKKVNTFNGGLDRVRVGRERTGTPFPFFLGSTR